MKKRANRKIRAAKDPATPAMAKVWIVVDKISSSICSNGLFYNDAQSAVSAANTLALAHPRRQFHVFESVSYAEAGVTPVKHFQIRA